MYAPDDIPEAVARAAWRKSLRIPDGAPVVPAYQRILAECMNLLSGAPPAAPRPPAEGNPP